MIKRIACITFSIIILISNINIVMASYKKDAVDVKFSDYPKIIELYIADDVESSDNRVKYFMVNDFHNLQNIYVSKNNENFTSFDGVLYNKDKTKLIVFPQAKDVAAIPKSCVALEAGCMYGLSSKLRKQIKAVITQNNKGKFPGYDKEIVDPKWDAMYLGVMQVTVSD